MLYRALGFWYFSRFYDLLTWLIAVIIKLILYIILCDVKTIWENWKKIKNRVLRDRNRFRRRAGERWVRAEKSVNCTFFREISVPICSSRRSRDDEEINVINYFVRRSVKFQERRRRRWVRYTRVSCTKWHELKKNPRYLYKIIMRRARLSHVNVTSGVFTGGGGFPGLNPPRSKKNCTSKLKCTV